MTHFRVDSPHDSSEPTWNQCHVPNYPSSGSCWSSAFCLWAVISFLHGLDFPSQGSGSAQHLPWRGSTYNYKDSIPLKRWLTFVFSHCHRYYCDPFILRPTYGQDSELDYGVKNTELPHQWLITVHSTITIQSHTHLCCICMKMFIFLLILFIWPCFLHPLSLL